MPINQPVTMMNHEKYAPQQDTEKRKRAFQDFQNMLASGELLLEEVDASFLEEFRREDRENIVEAFLGQIARNFKSQVDAARSKLDEPRKSDFFRSKPVLLKTDWLADLKDHHEFNFPRMYQILKREVEESEPYFEEYNKDIVPKLISKGYMDPSIGRPPFDKIVAPALKLHDQFQIPPEDYLPIAQHAMRYGYVESVFSNSEIFKRIPENLKKEFVNELIDGTAEGPFKGEQHITKIVNMLLFPSPIYRGEFAKEELENCRERRLNFQEYIGQLLIGSLQSSGRVSLQKAIVEQGDSFRELLIMVKDPVERKDIARLLREQATDCKREAEEYLHRSSVLQKFSTE